MYNKTEELEELLEKFSNAHGISGSEQEIAKMMEEQLKPYVDKIETDNMGNFISTIYGRSSTIKILLAAHMDEIGLTVRHIDKDGFLHFVKIGGLFEPTLLNQRVIVHTKKGPIVGVLGSKPPHVMEEADRKAPIKTKNLFIDIGAKDKEDAEALGVEIGTPMSMNRLFTHLANDLVTGKAFDNRAGVVMLIEAMKQLSKKDLDVTVHAVGTVQEEVGLKGARTVATKLKPTLAIAIDTTIPGDHPGMSDNESSLKLGEGPVITVMEASGRGTITHPKVLRLLKEAAIAKEIPYQLDVGDGGVTDGAIMQLANEGIPTGVISVPTRYIHSPVETLSMKDVENGAKLIVEAVLRASSYF